jgi:hypothetical protein
MKRETRRLLVLAVLFSVGIELFTIVCRHVYGGTGAEFAAKHGIPLVLRMHHFWWGLALIVIAVCLRRKPRLRFWLLAIGAGVFFSDMLHHFVYCPIVFGNTAWHWP